MMSEVVGRVSAHKPGQGGPSAEAVALMRCLSCGAGLELGPGLACRRCEQSYGTERGVARFLDQVDAFYEGAYTRQIRYVPGDQRLKDWAFFNLVQSGVLAEVKRVLPEAGVVVDLGCAGGVRWLGSAACTIGIDLSIDSLALAATTYAAALQASVFDLPIADNVVDVVYGSYVFEHLTADQKCACLREAYRVLKPGGHVVLQFDTLSNNKLTRFAQSDSAAFKRAFIDNDGHVGLAPLSQALRDLEGAGLSVVRRTAFGTTAVQYLPTYCWLDEAYGNRFVWVRGVGAVSKALASSRLGIAYEFAVTAFDRLLSPMADPDAATRAIVVARK